MKLAEPTGPTIRTTFQLSSSPSSRMVVWPGWDQVGHLFSLAGWDGDCYPVLSVSLRAVQRECFSCTALVRHQAVLVSKQPDNCTTR